MQGRTGSRRPSYGRPNEALCDGIGEQVAGSADHRAPQLTGGVRAKSAGTASTAAMRSPARPRTRSPRRARAAVRGSTHASAASRSTSRRSGMWLWGWIPCCMAHTMRRHRPSITDSHCPYWPGKSATPGASSRISLDGPSFLAQCVGAGHRARKILSSGQAAPARLRCALSP